MLLHDYFDKMTPENRAAYHAANKKGHHEDDD